MKSFRVRLAVSSAAISGVILLLFILGDTFVLYEESVELLDADISQTGNWYLERAADDRLHSTDFSQPVQGMIYDDPGQFFIVRISSQGELLYSRNGGWEAALAISEEGLTEFASVEVGDEKLRVGNLSLNGWQLCFAANLEVVHEEIVESLLMLLMILPGALLVIAVGGWWIGGVALAPIENITRIVEEITASGLDRRIPSGETEDEIGRLIRVLNDMIGRLESSFQQAARFSADASHQLKTPLTILQNEVDGALKSGEFSGEQIPVLLHLGEEIQRLKSIVESLLVLSRSDAGNLHLENERLDYGQLINELVEDTRILGGTQDITVDSHLAESVEVVGDESLLRQAILNLLDNAVRFNQPHGKIRCGLEREGAWAVLTIFNTGPGIQRHHHDHIFERFYRVFGDQQTHPKGFGLGLSLAFEITKAHNGRIELIRSDPDGTEFQLRLPAV